MSEWVTFTMPGGMPRRFLKSAIWSFGSNSIGGAGELAATSYPSYICAGVKMIDVRETETEIMTILGVAIP